MVKFQKASDDYKMTEDSVKKETKKIQSDWQKFQNAKNALDEATKKKETVEKERTALSDNMKNVEEQGDKDLEEMETQFMGYCMELNSRPEKPAEGADEQAEPA